MYEIDYFIAENILPYKQELKRKGLHLQAFVVSSVVEIFYFPDNIR